MTQERWDIRREGQRWTREEFERQIDQSRPAVEIGDEIIATEARRCTMLGLLLQDLGIDIAVRFGNLADWKAAIADLERETIGSQS